MRVTRICRLELRGSWSDLTSQVHVHIDLPSRAFYWGQKKKEPKKKSTFKPDIKMGTMMWLHFSLIDSIRKYFRENEVTILTFEHVPWDLVTI